MIVRCANLRRMSATRRKDQPPKIAIFVTTRRCRHCTVHNGIFPARTNSHVHAHSCNVDQDPRTHWFVFFLRGESLTEVRLGVKLNSCCQESHSQSKPVASIACMCAHVPSFSTRTFCTNTPLSLSTTWRPIATSFQRSFAEEARLANLPTSLSHIR